MKIVKKDSFCEVCGKVFQGDFIEHETPIDDYEWENAPEYREFLKLEWEDEARYPHWHEQPTVECHICPKCREEEKEA
jgi:hypothetical protein